MSAERHGGEHHRPALRIVHGDPTPEEVAALVAVLAAAGGDEGQAPSGPVAQWATPERLLRRPLAPTGWWESSLPR
ncbi:MAG: hypothetical protein MUF35_01005 [Candidatus Nanopelagicales bacterium]|nr:hypothetical protein [Candidatus Nanopelagicales bacterium]